MPNARILRGLAEVADRYDAILCDVWGVIHNGRESFPEPCAALARFQEARGPVVLISNAPRPAEAVKPQLAQLKVPDAAWSDFVTSGDATRRELAARAPGPVWAVGPARDTPLYEGLALDFVELADEAAFVSCTGPFDDEVDTPEDYRARFEVCVGRGLEMICANPDRVVRRGDKMIYCGGALADVYAELGGEVVMAGKPYAPVYACAYEALSKALGRPVDKARILAIGDGVPTDILGANNEGLDVLFVAEGIEAAETLEGGALHQEKLDAFLRQRGVSATHAMPHLRW